MRFSGNYPDFKAEIVSQQKSDFHGNDPIDLYFLPVPLKSNMRHVILKKDVICILVSEGLLKNTYGSRWQSICSEMDEKEDINLLRELPFVDLRKEKEHGITPIWDIISETGFKPKSVISTDNKEINISLCISGYGAMLSVEDDLKRILSGKNTMLAEKIHIFTLSNQPQNVSLAVSYRKGKKLAAVEEAFILTAKDYFEE